jgi:beta-glucosidase
VRVSNTSRRRGSEVVQLYVGDAESTVRRPRKELKAFAKVALDPGESRMVTLDLDDRAFAFWDAQTHDWRAESGAFELHIGASSRDIRHVVRLERGV